VITVAHMTSVHRLDDTRIRMKECRTLIKAGYRVVLVGSGVATELVDGVREQTVRIPGSRVGRILLSAPLVILASARLRPAVFHIHDPELLPAAPLLRLLGGHVIYDAHEDLPKQVMSKHWIPQPLRRFVSRLIAAALPLAYRRLDAVVAATPAIAAASHCRRIALIQNFPEKHELLPVTKVPYAEREQTAAYVGGLTEIRGGRPLVRALLEAQAESRVRLALAGSVSPANFAAHLRQTPGWEFVDELGWLSRVAVGELLGRSRLGLVVFLPAENHLEAQPTKIFEYMSAGIPVVASDFPLWRRIVEGSGCGIMANASDPSAIAEAIAWLLTHPDEAEQMGERGRQAVLHSFNWEREARKLAALYEEILS
jgi:glycosyltransferase involved in cell wall biosynthesis